MTDADVDVDVDGFWEERGGSHETFPYTALRAKIRC